MARDLKIKVKNENGDLEFRKVDFLPEIEITALENTLKKSEFKFSDKGRQKTKIIRETREYELITPLFGGGAITKKADEISVIRATEIRGHLRFWWRATRGGQFNGDLVEMKKYEDAIFGSTDKHSALQIEVVLEEDYEKRNKLIKDSKDTWIKIKKVTDRTGKVFPKPDPDKQMKDFQYVAFPLQPNEKEKQDFDWRSEVSVGVKFTVTFTYPEKFRIYKKNRKGEIIKDSNRKPIIEKEYKSFSEIQSAFWAWENFGGIGARTRRGFGALKLCKHRIDGISQTVESFTSKEQMQKQAENVIYDGKVPKSVPHLTKNFRFFITNENRNEREVWKNLVNEYKTFRQQRIGTGRSKWNEPEVIRNLTGQRLTTSKPEDSHPPKKPDFEKFPRAEFGLPIVFQFYYEDTWKKRRVRSDDKNVDPRKTILKVSDLPNQKRERFSSPLILRPLACQNGNFVGIALILENETTLDQLGLTLEAQENPKQIVKTGLKSKLDETAKEHEQIKAIDGSNLLSTADVLQAFLDYLGR